MRSRGAGRVRVRVDFESAAAESETDIARPEIAATRDRAVSRSRTDSRRNRPLPFLRHSRNDPQSPRNSKTPAGCR